MIKRVSKKFGRTVDISDAFFANLMTNTICFYCCAPLRKRGTHGHAARRTLQLDRLDSAQGYVDGNVVSCCRDCNMLKNAWLTPEETLLVAALRNDMKISIKQATENAATRWRENLIDFNCVSDKEYL
ncbi:MAG: hypothetical protein EOO61_14630 [Hymenobacter sp.]|nr:MAG: hypothetical protein EOO61_14630 [Hymenobacter sp.]